MKDSLKTVVLCTSQSLVGENWLLCAPLPFALSVGTAHPKNWLPDLASARSGVVQQMSPALSLALLADRLC